MRTRVKICGITSAEDAALAVRAGADAVGVVLAESSRQVSIDEAAEAFADVPPPVARIGVFVDAPIDYVEHAVAQIGLTAVQFHGSETPEMCAVASVSVIKAFRVGTEFDTEAMEPYQEVVAAVLLDTYDSQSSGGTGKTFDWQRTTPGLPGWAPVFVAGGLNPINVGEAIRMLHPFAVDVSSGVEERLRQKDRFKIEAFVDAVRGADGEVGP